METSKDSKGSEFHVLLSGLKLPAALEKKIASGIQSVVASTLAGYPNPDDPDGDDGPDGGGSRGPFAGGNGTPYVVLPSLRWRGYWIKALGKDFKITPAEIDVQQQQLQKGIQIRG
ncbi:hypothetical protein [Spirosoma luteum]|uniref:hypothetical protein n=1 Tax=Spirosoma luteum TaxID=431553 RepID=UPI00035DA434|nr:hypothetical protein [Spirosoma luteum]